MNLVVYDIETTTLEVKRQVYDLKVGFKRFDPDDITRDWSILGAAWKTLGGPTKCVSVSSQDVFNDRAVVEMLHAVLMDADVLIGHNSDAFDLKKFNARAIIYGLPPIPKKPMVDTLKVARQNFRFTSNKLAYIARHLGVTAKGESPDWDLILAGDIEELARMREYNKLDVEVTEQVYLKLRPYIKNHPNLNLLAKLRDTAGERLENCPSCLSPDLQRRGTRVTRAGAYAQYQCRSCGSWCQDRKNQTTVNKR